MRHRRALMSSAVALLVVVALAGCRSAVSGDGAPTPPRGYANMTFLKAALALGRIELIDTEPAIPEELHVERDVAYREVDGRELAFDVYRRADQTEPAPLLVFIHGGSWKSGDRDDYRRYLVDYALEGYVTATVSYRFMQDATYPAAVDDVRCAVARLLEDADLYGVDAGRVALIGGSAGGHLAMMVAYSSAAESGTRDAEPCELPTPSPIRCIVNFYGPTDLTTGFAVTHPTVTGFLGTDFETDPDVFAAASPITHVSSDDPPTLVFHGTIDDVVPVEQSDDLVDRLTDAGVAVEYHRLEGWPHTMDAAVEVNDYCRYYMDDFFRRHLALE